MGMLTVSVWVDLRLARGSSLRVAVFPRTVPCCRAVFLLFGLPAANRCSASPVAAGSLNRTTVPPRRAALRPLPRLPGRRRIVEQGGGLAVRTRDPTVFFLPVVRPGFPRPTDSFLPLGRTNPAVGRTSHNRYPCVRAPSSPAGPEQDCSPLGGGRSSRVGTSQVPACAFPGVPWGLCDAHRVVFALFRAGRVRRMGLLLPVNGRNDSPGPGAAVAVFCTGRMLRVVLCHDCLLYTSPSPRD